MPPSPSEPSTVSAHDLTRIGGDWEGPLQDLLERLPDLAPLKGEMEGAFRDLYECLAGGGKLLLCGNGGSAADCDHWAGELLKGFAQTRPLSEVDQQTLPDPLGQQLQQGLAAIPLTAFPALMTAFANDVEPDLAFAQLVWALGRPGDILIGISTSGNARNVLHAVHAARAKGLRTLALTGRSGGKLAPEVDRALRAPADETYRIQEYHLPVYHTLSLMLECAFFH